jgi:hypothetical protein
MFEITPDTRSRKTRTGPDDPVKCELAADVVASERARGDKP